MKNFNEKCDKVVLDSLRPLSDFRPSDFPTAPRS